MPAWSSSAAGRDAINAMGDKALAKAHARRRALRAGLPGADQSDERLAEAAPGARLPLLVKAVAGRRRARHAPRALGGRDRRARPARGARRSRRSATAR